MIARGLLLWLIGAAVSYWLLYVATKDERRKVARKGRRMLVAGGIGLVAAVAMSLLNNISGV